MADQTRRTLSAPNVFLQDGFARVIKDERVMQIGEYSSQFGSHICFQGNVVAKRIMSKKFHKIEETDAVK